ncbi:hypothetical protein [Peribacillus frigoritolerans]|uniref:hypothetical protein n=1 Tax=Peribacillus frigoritolerans TaxID=450367 RepID=UPI00105A5787|nr:hypothetical protein [Peribacillus frigoritolerans]TDL74241.1 hypothetical protein E2R53_22820 [Peribacillus frigoritolerans]
MDKSYEGVILELLTRIQSLEDRVHVLENHSDEEKTVSDEEVFTEEDNSQKITRSIARSHVMNRLNSENRDLMAIKGNKASGASIIVQSKKNPTKELKAKFYYSKSHLKHISSWHTVWARDIQDDRIDLHIFTVSFNQEFYTFFFTKDELRDFIKGKRSDNADLYHFYFQEINNRFVEVREHEYDVSKYFDRWELVSDLI